LKHRYNLWSLAEEGRATLSGLDVQGVGLPPLKLQPHLLSLQEEIEAMDRLKVFTLSNLALCSTCLGDFSSAVMYASKGLELEGDNPKLFFRCAATPSALLSNNSATLRKCSALPPARGWFCCQPSQAGGQSRSPGPGIIICLFIRVLTALAVLEPPSCSWHAAPSLLHWLYQEGPSKVPEG